MGRKAEGPVHPEVVALSELLNRLPVESPGSHAETFRNPAGVAMKLGNFLSRDPEYRGSGLTRELRLLEHGHDLLDRKSHPLHDKLPGHPAA